MLSSHGFGSIDDNIGQNNDLCVSAASTAPCDPLGSGGSASFGRIADYVGGRRVSVLGFGVTNIPLVRVLLAIGAEVTVRDKKPFSALPDEACGFKERGVRFICGDSAFESFDELDGELIFRTPGLRPDTGAIPAAVSGGAYLSSEIELFLTLSRAPVFAVTGSDGKTTTTTLTGRFLARDRELASEGSAYVGGNIGSPLPEFVCGIETRDRAVLELSSFQLMGLPPSFSPHFSAITNLSPNHLDWHRGMEEYLDAKKRIVGDRTRRLVTNFECEATLAFAREIYEKKKKEGSDFELILFSSRKTCREDFGLAPELDSVGTVYLSNGEIRLSYGRSVSEDEATLLEVSRIKIPGRHNIENFMTAMALTYGQVDPRVYGDVADSFFGVEHRLELSGVIDGCEYYNSSIDSSPSRTAAALSALDGRDIVIICGGYDKKIPYEPLADAIFRHRVRAVVLTGATAQKIGSAIEAHGLWGKRELTVVRDPEFDSAVREARRLAREGGCVLLSPASASFDAFKNFAERGERFKALVGEMTAEQQNDKS